MNLLSARIDKRGDSIDSSILFNVIDGMEIDSQCGLTQK
jgi:hypothetical protein